MILLLQAGCATLNEEECLNADWRSIGCEDGARGARPSRIGQHRQACAEYAIQPDLDAYNAGHKQGLKTYCRPGNGYHAGLKGSSYNNVCPAALERGFLQAYKAGHHIYKLETQIRSLAGQIKKEEKELDEVKTQLGQLEAELVSDGVSSQRRIELLAEVREQGKAQGKLENQIKTLGLDMARLQGQVEGHRAESTY